MHPKLKISLIGTMAALMALGSVIACNKITAVDERSLLCQSLDSLFCTVFPESDAPGGVVMVVKGDSLVYSRAFGMATLDRNEKMTDSTLLNICSISKQFSAVALLKLEEQGLLSLDNKLSDYFNKPALFDRITLSHILSHSSGLPDNRPYTDDDWKKYQRHHNSCFNNINDFCHYSLWQESCAFYTSLDTLKFEPGTAYDYQNPTYQLVLPIVESTTGKNFDVWMKEKIFKPAGMKETYYFQQGRTIPRMAHAYRPADKERATKAFVSDNGQWEEYDYGEANYFPTKADGGIFTSARDFIRWQRALFGGKIISQQSLHKAITPHIATDIADTGYGYGFFIERKPGMPRKIYHTGDNGAFYTYAATVPRHDVNYLIFANRNDWNREATVEAMDSVLRVHGIM